MKKGGVANSNTVKHLGLVWWFFKSNE